MIKKVVSIMNSYNHHQSELSKELWNSNNGDYFFIETKKMSEERIKMGWQMRNIPDYIISSTDVENFNEEIKNLIDHSDVLIYGNIQNKLLRHRQSKSLLTFKYSERFIKNKKIAFQYPLRVIKYFLETGMNKNTYLLCASAYASSDFNKVFQFRNKCFKWGYFPETPQFENPEEIIKKKETNSILWVGRFIGWKHPELAIMVANSLRNNNVDFKLRMIGNGPLFETVKNQINELNLQNYVELLGNIDPILVQEYMKDSQILLCTSDFNEGWGAVVNEGMGNACLVIASQAMGSVPFLIKNNENGLIFDINNPNDLPSKIERALSDKNLLSDLSLAAYWTIQNEWNAKIAAERLLAISEEILNNRDPFKLYQSGPGSISLPLKNCWFK